MNRSVLVLFTGLLLLLGGCMTSGKEVKPQAEPWVAEPWQESTPLTSLDPLYHENLSGAHWNPVTKTLFVVTNKPGFMWRLQLDDGGFKVVGRYGIPGDLEAVTQADFNDDLAYVLDEKGEEILGVRWRNRTAIRIVSRWSLSDFAPAVGRRGPEGLVFIPDSFLSEMGFVDGDGHSRTSRNGMGGLMFVAHQVAGNIHVFDLAPQGGKIDLVGTYSTSRSESSGLAFDRQHRLFYIWHNIDGNYLEQATLVSLANGKQRKFQTIQEVTGPKTGNLEGIALGSAGQGRYFFFICDDDNQDNYGLMWFQNFPRPEQYQE